MTAKTELVTDLEIPEVVVKVRKTSQGVRGLG